MVCDYFAEAVPLKLRVVAHWVWSGSCFTHSCKEIKETENKVMWQHTNINPPPHSFVAHW